MVAQVRAWEVRVLPCVALLELCVGANSSRQDTEHRWQHHGDVVSMLTKAWWTTATVATQCVLYCLVTSQCEWRRAHGGPG